MTNLERISSTLCFGGKQERYQHWSDTNQCTMTFGIFLPSHISQPSPAVYWLSGLTCSDENFMQKAGAQRYAAELGLILIAPDTSPRGSTVPDDPEGNWDLGLGAGFYVNATQPPWSTHYQMFDYVNRELPALIDKHFPTNGLRSVCGHSMGGHGALISAMRFPGIYRSASAFAPISNPMECPWGQKAFSHYIGGDKRQWQDYDSCYLLKNRGIHCPVLIDQGSADNFLEEQLNIDCLQKIVEETKTDIQIDIQQNYDHSYYFIASFIGKHLAFHAKHLAQYL